MTTTSDDGLRDFTLAELQKLTHLCAVHGKVYDLEKFAPLHPGGDDIRLFGGYDATVHYHMLHPFHAHVKAAAVSGAAPIMPPSFAKCCVGRLVTESPDAAHSTFTTPTAASSGTQCVPDGFVYNSVFARDLIGTVQKYFKDNNLSPHATPVFWARLLAYCTLFFVSVVAFALQPSLARALVAGAASAWIGLCVQHDANHGALSANPTINKIAGSMADLIGQCRFLWMQQHVVHHHAYTNDHACDRDSTSAEPFLFFNPAVPEGTPTPTARGVVRAPKPAPRSTLAAYQHMFFFLVLPFYYLLRFDVLRVFNISKYDDTPKNAWLVSTQRTRTMVLYALHIGWFYVLPLYWHLSWSTLLLCHVRDSTSSLMLTLLFLLSHNAMPIKRFPSRTSDWYAMQVETSCTYGDGVAGALSGGLNFQIEHHLFPRVCSIHYPQLSPLIRAVCAKHDVAYTYFPTVLDNFKSTVAYMRKVGVAGLETGF